MPHRAFVLALFAFVAAPVAVAYPVHYLVLELRDDDTIALTSRALVTTEGEMQPDDEREHVTPAWRQRIFAELRDGNGKKVWHQRIDVERYTRVESPGQSGIIVGSWIRLERVPFVVRVPAGDGTRLELTVRPSGTRTDIDLDDASSLRSLGLGPAVTSGLITGPASNRLDVLITGDGYTAAEQSKFEMDAANLAATFYGITPYAEYKNLVNIRTLFVASLESGADHPVCSDPSKDPDPLEGTFRETAFDATYCSVQNVQRTLAVSTSKVYAAAQFSPDWDKIFVIVNDSMYGGSGGPIAVASIHPSVTTLMQHEFGHSFTRLADEYNTPFTLPACDDASTPVCEPNVTNVAQRASIKWNSWILDSTPIPSPNSSVYSTVVGLFQGARYSESYYRPMYNCLMKHLGVPFCAICSQAYVLRLYQGGWGNGTSPAAGIDLIEPGLETPSPSATVIGGVGSPTTFTASVIQPIGGPAVKIEWLVDGAIIAGETMSQFSYVPLSGGLRQIMLRVADQTPLVNTAMAPDVMYHTRNWTLNVSPLSAPGALLATASTSSVALTWNGVSGASGYQIERNSAEGVVTLGTVPTTTFTDDSLPAGGYLYRVRAVDGSSLPGPWSVDLATVFTATDGELTAGATLVRAAHILELRTAVNNARRVAGLAPFAFTTGVAVGAVIGSNDFLELREAANAARIAAGLAGFTFTDAILAGHSVRAVHLSELRQSIR